MTGDQIWNEIATVIRDRIGDLEFNLWLEELTVVAFDGETLALGVRHAFHRAWLMRRYSAILQQAVETSGCDVNLDMVLLPPGPPLEVSNEPTLRVLSRAPR